MRKDAIKILPGVVFLTALSFAVQAQTNVSGYILSNTTWTMANSPYIVTGNILVSNGVTLTIEPGVTVKFDSTKALQVDGELIAIGNAQNRIMFTSSSSSPVRGSWGRIQFKDSSTDGILDTDTNYVSGSILKYCDILYGGGIGNTGAVDCDSSAPYISHCRISQSKSSGIYFNYSTNGGIDSCSIKYCDERALSYNYPLASDLTIKNDTFMFTKGIISQSGWNEDDPNFTSAHFYNNLFSSNTENAIYLFINSCTIMGNSFISNSSINTSIIGIYNMNYCKIANNEFRLNIVSLQSYSYDGGVIYLYNLYPSNNIISNNVFISNSVTQPVQWSSSGKGSVIIMRDGEISNNYFLGNTNVLNFNGRLCCNTFIQNQSPLRGIFTTSYYGLTVENNVFESNTAASGSVWQAGHNSTFANNLFRNNSAPNGNIISFTGSNNSVHNNDFLGNSGTSCLSINEQTDITANNFQNPGVQYEINNLRLWGTPNIQASNNYWGTSSTAHIDSVIRDFFDDGTYSVVFYVPALTAPALVDTTCPIVVCSLSVSGTVVPPSCNGGSNGSINITVSNGTTPYSYVWSTGSSSEDIGGLTSGTYAVTVIDANLCSATKSFSVSQPVSPVAVVSAVVTNANCNSGGAINIASGGGTIPYTYNWGSGITTQNRSNLIPGNYSVTVSDNYNCSATQSFTVGQDAGPIISGAAANTSCNNSCDGAINLSITGVTPFTYDWGNGSGASEDTSGLCAGTYNVTVADSNNCGIATSFVISSPAALIATATVASDVTCFGFSDGAASAAASNGTPSYSFLWSDGQTTATAAALAAGTYAVTITDSLGCTDSASVAMADGHAVFAGVILGLNSADIGQHYIYSVNASISYVYDWTVSNGIIVAGQGNNGIEVKWTSSGAGLIELIASEQGCADTVSKSVTVVDTTQNCSALFYLYPDTIPHSYFVVNTASGIAPLYYSWNWGDGSSTETAAYPSHTYTAAGFYTICLSISDSAGCTDSYCNPYYLLKTENGNTMITVNVYPPSFTSVRDAALASVELYPNPTNGTFTVKAINIKGQATLKLFNALGRAAGQAIETDELNRGVMIDLSRENEGIYFLEIRSESGSRVMKVVRY